MTPTTELIEQALARVPGFSRVVVGFSGGLDSTVLLDLVRRWQQLHPSISLLALHINHQLQAAADQWQLHCELLCQHWAVPFASEVVRVDPAKASLEQAARQVRYAAFKRHVREQDVLLLAHHRDDQVETLLQRLLRGSGPLGLGGMGTVSRVQDMTVLRPLLELDRSELEVWARDEQLHWINDPSNQDVTPERNFIRAQVLPLLRTRWPRLNQTVARSARLSRSSAELLDELAQLDADGLCQPGKPLPLDVLTALSLSRSMNLLRFWIRLQGLTPPSEAQLHRVLEEMLPCGEDAQPELVWGGNQLRRYRQALYCVPVLSPPHGKPVSFSLREPLPSLPVGKLWQRPDQGVAFARSRLAQAPLALQTRMGGERIKPTGRPANSLKHWLQVCAVPPWWREHWPILYCGDQIAGLPGLLVCEGFSPVTDDDAVWLDWEPPGAELT